MSDDYLRSRASGNPYGFKATEQTSEAEHLEYFIYSPRLTPSEFKMHIGGQKMGFDPAPSRVDDLGTTDYGEIRHLISLRK